MGKRGPKAAPQKNNGDYLNAADRGLTATERSEWNRIVRTKAPGFYREEDVQLLKKYCRQVELSNRYDKALQDALDNDDLNTFDLFSKKAEKAISQLLALCRMLKIGPLTRETQRRAEKSGRVGVPEKQSLRAGLMYSGEPAETPQRGLN